MIELTTVRRTHRWLVICSCGYERECISAWGATATAKLHVQHLGEKAVPHHITIKEPPQVQPTPRTQLELP